MRSCQLIYAVYIALFTVFDSGAQTYIEAGSVSGAWDSTGSPYLIEGNINVQEDSQLYINPGTRVMFLGAYQLQVHGYINASGTLNDSISFSCPDTVDSWLGIRLIDFVQILPDSVRFTYCNFNKVRKDHPDSLGGAFFAKNSPRISIDHCLFHSNYSGSGGAIYLRNSSASIRNTILRNNEAERGGAIYIHQSAPHIYNLEVSDNTGTVGGGMYFYSSGGVLEYSSISGNTSLGGGGGIILHKGSSLEMQHNEISNNTASGSGGGIALLEGNTPLIEFCKISHNTTIFDEFVANGGGMYIAQFDNYPTVQNTEISFNTSAGEGGGIHTESNLNLVSCLVIQNEANTNSGFGGGGIHAIYDRCLVLNCTFSGNIGQQGSSIYASGSDIDLVNTIIWDDEISSVKKVYMRNFLSAPVLNVDHSLLEGGEQQIGNTGSYELQWGENNIDQDPLFVDPFQADFSLQVQSPCINSGLLDTLAFILPNLDLAGNPRVSGPAIDMGSYENQAPVDISEHIETENIIARVFPVPARDHININLNPAWSGRSFILEILTSTAQLVHKQRVNGFTGQVTLNTSDMNAGLYLLRIQGGGKVETRIFSVIK